MADDELTDQELARERFTWGAGDVQVIHEGDEPADPPSMIDLVLGALRSR